MVANSIQNLDQSQYFNAQKIQTPRPEQTAVEQQNQKAAGADLNSQTANRVQEAFKINISREGEEMSRASEQAEKEAAASPDNRLAAPEDTGQSQTNYSGPADNASRIVNIVA